MKKITKNKKYLIILIALLLLFFVISGFNFGTNEPISVVSEENIIENEPQKKLPDVSDILTIGKNQNTDDNIQKIAEENVGTDHIVFIAGVLNKRLKIIPGESLYDSLIYAKNQSEIFFEGKEYPGLGFFVTSIGEFNANGGKYLIYYINNKEATVGVSSYIPKDGDVIRWELK